MLSSIGSKSPQKGPALTLRDEGDPNRKTSIRSPQKLTGHKDSSSSDESSSGSSSPEDRGRSSERRLAHITRETRSIQKVQSLQPKSDYGDTTVGKVTEHRIVSKSNEMYSQERIPGSKIQYDLAEKENPIRASPVRAPDIEVSKIDLPRSRSCSSSESRSAKRRSDYSDSSSDDSGSSDSEEDRKKSVKKVEVGILQVLILADICSKIVPYIVQVFNLYQYVFKD